MRAWVAVGLGLIVSWNGARGALYNGNGSTSFGGAVGTGSLTLTDNGTTVSGTLTRGTGGSGTFTDFLVIYIDSKSGGFSSTSGFTDYGSLLRKAVSGADGVNTRALADFASGFSADYAIAIRPFKTADPGSLFQLANNGAYTLVSSVNISPTGTSTSSSYTFSFSLSDIGVTGGQGTSIKFESTYIGIGNNNDAVIRSLESFESVAYDPDNPDRIIFANYDTYVTAVPETTQPALAIFGGIVIGFGFLRHVRRRNRRLDFSFSP